MSILKRLLTLVRRFSRNEEVPAPPPNKRPKPDLPDVPISLSEKVNDEIFWDEAGLGR
ncbi:MAG: hypothetical protein JWN89_201 [Parcubacteria group bacterium]|nr:hypothetical protein [Parcubacteria group bacterium]